MIKDSDWIRAKEQLDSLSVPKATARQLFNIRQKLLAKRVVK